MYICCICVKSPLAHWRRQESRRCKCNPLALRLVSYASACLMDDHSSILMVISPCLLSDCLILAGFDMGLLLIYMLIGIG